MTKYIKIILLVFVLIASTITIWNEVKQQLEIETSLESDLYLEASDSEIGFLDSTCNVAGIIMHGDLYTYYSEDPDLPADISSAEDLVYYLELAEDTPNIEVILLEIDSYGGSPAAAEEVVATLKKRVNKPVIAQIRGGGTSAAYWIASASDIIFASALSEVGSIGVTMSYVDESKLNTENGYTFNQINTGKFKDSGSIEKPLTEEERVLFQRDTDIMFEAFLASVSNNRNMEIEKVRALADGSSMLGQMAKENGLIDEIGGIYEVLDYIESRYAIDPVVCW